MASTVFVIDPSSRSTKVKVTPSTPLRDVLEEACKTRKLSPDGYTLKTQTSKTLDLSQPWRLSGLSAGAKLNLIQASRSPSVVSVALQLPQSEGGLRQQDKFASDTSLWLVLRKFEDGIAGASGKKLNLTQRGVPSGNSGAGRLLYEQPVLNLMGRSLETFADLQKTLGQLGLTSGSHLLRIAFKQSDQPLEEAMRDIGTYFKSLDSVPAGIGSAAQQERGAHAGPDGIMSSVPDASANDTIVPAEATGPEPSEDVPMPDASATAAPQPEDNVIASSSITELQPQPDSQAAPASISDGIQVYRAPSSSTPAAAQQLDDPTTFEPTVDHAKAHQAALTRAGKNQRLLSDKELEEQEKERETKLAAVQQVVFRVRYPDQSMIETTAYASETGADLYAKVKETLAAESEPFELRYAGTKGQQAVPDTASRRLVKDLGFRGKVLITLAWTDKTSAKARSAPSLKEKYRVRAQDLKVDLQQQSTEASAAPTVKEAEPVKKAGGASKVDLESKMKKWLGRK
ncbi:hypothetical protein K431DRAFT_281056 [Polychaeton citri CBS 116435]|uniref:RBD domain-containing protein n=1 Tax=Polychaeton citri CBS 116435 TaxID=1314669 RepID=A0A9P4QG90_9PEZI|nr:hypothetical protein K431DRAFT_281056 [Polychaeton citri CBS 116435]